MPFGRTPLEALALPGTILAHKYSQFRQRRRDAANKRVTERELSALHNKIVSILLNCYLYYIIFNIVPTPIMGFNARKTNIMP